MMFSTKVLPIALAFNLVAAWDVTQRDRCTREGNFCLTSFIWCNNDDCNWPENAIPTTDRPSQYASAALELETRQPYRLTWQGVDPAYPLQIEYGQVRPAQWSTNITATEKGYYDFEFYNILSEIVDNENPDANQTERYRLQIQRFWSAQSSINNFWISQPERPNPAGVDSATRYWFDESSQFSILPSGTGSLVRINRELLSKDINHRWSLGVGIGVGVGVPLLLALAFLVGQWYGKKVTTRKFDASSDDKVPVHSKHKVMSYPVR